MAKKTYTNYQRDVIERYYANLDAIKLQTLQEIVTDLYLATTDAKRNRLWERAENAMAQLRIKPGLMKHILQKRSVEVLAENVQDWLKQTHEK